MAKMHFFMDKSGFLALTPQIARRLQEESPSRRERKAKKSAQKKLDKETLKEMEAVAKGEAKVFKRIEGTLGDISYGFPATIKGIESRDREDEWQMRQHAQDLRDQERTAYTQELSHIVRQRHLVIAANHFTKMTQIYSSQDLSHYAIQLQSLVQSSEEPQKIWRELRFNQAVARSLGEEKRRASAQPGESTAASLLGPREELATTKAELLERRLEVHGQARSRLFRVTYNMRDKLAGRPYLEPTRMGEGYPAPDRIRDPAVMADRTSTPSAPVSIAPVTPTLNDKKTTLAMISETLGSARPDRMQVPERSSKAPTSQTRNSLVPEHNHRPHSASALDDLGRNV